MALLKVPSVEARPVDPGYQTARGADADAFGAGIAKAVQGLGQSIGQTAQPVDRMALQLQAEDNERQAKDLDNQFSAFVRDYTLGDGGFYTKKGEAAIAAGPRVQEDIEKKRQELLGKAPNKRVRDMFDLSSSSRANTTYDKAAGYILQERNAANNATAQTRIFEATQDAAAAYNDDKQLNRSQAIIENEVNALGELNGWSPEIIASKIQTERTNMYSQAIRSAMKHQQTDVARNLFDRVKSTLDGVEQAELAKIISSEDLLGKAQRTADEIVAAHTDFNAQYEAAGKIADPKLRKETEDMIIERAGRLAQLYNIDRTLSTQERQTTILGESDRIMSMPGTEADKLAAARAIEDPEIRSAVTADISNRLTETRTLENREYDRVLGVASQAINSGQTLNEWAAANPEEYMTLSKNTQAISGLREAQKAVAEGRLFAEVTDGETLGQLQRLPAVKLSEVNPEIYRYQLTKEEYSKLSNMVASASASVEKVKENFSVYGQGESALKDMAPKDLSWDDPKQSSADKKLQNDAMNQMNTFIHGFVSNGKLPTMEQIQDEATRLMTKIVTNKQSNAPWVLGSIIDWWNGSSEALGLQVQRMDPSELANARVSIENIQPSAVKAVEDQFREMGVTPTEDLVEQYFGALVVKDNSRMMKLMRQVDTSGVTESYVKKVSTVESNNRPNAKARTSTATGLYQFTEGSWLEAISALAPEFGTDRSREEVLELRKDPGVSTEVFKRFTARNQQFLRNANIPVNDATMYMAHFLGAGAARKVLRMPDDVVLDSVLSEKSIKANSFLKGKTVGWIKNWARNKMAQ